MARPGPELDHRQLLAGICQSIHMSARGQTRTDRTKLLHAEILRAPGSKSEILDRVYHKGGGCLAVDGSKVRSLLTLPPSLCIDGATGDRQCHGFCGWKAFVKRQLHHVLMFI